MTVDVHTLSAAESRTSAIVGRLGAFPVGQDLLQDILLQIIDLRTILNDRTKNYLPDNCDAYNYVPQDSISQYIWIGVSGCYKEVILLY